MAVNFPSIDPAQLHPVAGVTLGWAEANIRKPNRKDVLVVSIDEGATVSGVFTENRFCAAPVTVCREHLAKVRAGGAGIRALVVNTATRTRVRASRVSRMRARRARSSRASRASRPSRCCRSRRA